ncbi:hypothetical protein CEXT_1891 [Caerostris extrusa]|uniref:Uncharacterized protein n=1 Tax=Caerostris extrusa TaxID=172846 RepID=A0AAV4XPA9_CAEEX|nr:hypothetical protein CEXT_1891 [Caerostris extrusa]
MRWDMYLNGITPFIRRHSGIARNRSRKKHQQKSSLLNRIAIPQKAKRSPCLFAKHARPIICKRNELVKSDMCLTIRFSMLIKHVAAPSKARVSTPYHSWRSHVNELEGASLAYLSDSTPYLLRRRGPVGF